MSQLIFEDALPKQLEKSQIRENYFVNYRSKSTTSDSKLLNGIKRNRNNPEELKKILERRGIDLVLLPYFLYLSMNRGHSQFDTSKRSKVTHS